MHHLEMGHGAHAVAPGERGAVGEHDGAFGAPLLAFLDVEQLPVPRREGVPLAVLQHGALEDLPHPEEPPV